MRDGTKEISNTLSGGLPMTKYLHTMIRVSSLEDSIALFEVLGLRGIRRRPDEKGATPPCSSPPPATRRLPWNSPTIGIPSPTPAAVISDISHTSWTTSTTPAALLSPAA